MCLVERIRTAIIQNPTCFLEKAGSTPVSQWSVTVKSGAEGVMAASIPALGYGLAVKINDGAQRAATAVMADLLLQVLQKHRLVTTKAKSVLEGYARFRLKNWNGADVGSVEPVSLAGQLSICGYSDSYSDVSEITSGSCCFVIVTVISVVSSSA